LLPTEPPASAVVPALAILNAVNFAAIKHIRQTRKNVEKSPYINHPVAVAETIAQVGGVYDLATLQAAILHDTIEDTETTREDLELAFGAEVADLVCEVTDDKSLDKARRKELQIEHAPHLSSRAKLIKIADKTCNVRDITASPPSEWSHQRKREYLDHAESVVSQCRGINPQLEAHFDESLDRARRALEREG
jgi:guanosine-3',5'-bis(diphosphate) 3'-pyrophosphohydrolase